MKKLLSLFVALVCVMSMYALQYNVTVPAGTNACYIAGEMTSWSQTEMTKVDATHYTITIDGANASMKYKYCSGPGWSYVEKDASGGEMGDRTYSENDVVATWAAVYVPVIITGDPKDITVKAKMPATWTNAITAWVWETGKEGTEIVPTKEGDWYVYTKHCVEMNIIFKNGTGWNGDANQTSDIEHITESTCYQIVAGAGKANPVVIDCEGGDTPDNPNPGTGLTYSVTVPAGTKACYIAGEMNEWTQTAMTKVDETHYTITYDNATSSMKYKYCSGPSWDYVEMQADGVTDIQDRTYATYDIVAKWKAVYDPNGSTTPDNPNPGTGLTYSVTVPVGTKACYIAGEMNEWTQTAMTKVDETHYTITYDNATSSMKYKYCSGPSWDYVEMQADGVTDIQDRTYSANDVVAVWKAVYTPTDTPNPDDPNPGKELTYNVTVPAGTKACYIAGEMNKWTHVAMTKVDETHYTITYTNATEAMKYKYCSGPSWDYVEMQADGVTDIQERTYAANDVVAVWKAVYVPEDNPNPDNPNPDNPNPDDPNDDGKLVVKAKMPAHWTYIISAWVWETGGEGRLVFPTQEGNWYIIREACTELNVVFRNGADWSTDANKTVDMKFSKSTCIELSQTGANKATYTVVDCETTDLEDVTLKEDAIKFIQDGQLFILHNGVLYNVYGQIVK